MSYTKGPWRWTDEYQARDLSDTWSLVGDDGYGILSCDGKSNSPSEFHPANAALISAAPELLEALEYAMPYLEACIPSPRNGVNSDGSVDINVIDRARASIAKAKGEVK